MKDQDKTSQQLLADLACLRSRIATLEAGRAEHLAEEKSLRVRCAEFQAIYEGMADGALMAEIETKRFVLANPAICHMLGYTAEELLTMSVEDIHPPKHCAQVVATFEAQALGFTTIAEEIPVQRKDGSVFYADILISRILFGGHPCLLGFFRDITERHQAADALSRNELKYRELVEAANSIILRMNIHGMITFINHFGEAFFGYERGELLGKTILDTIVPQTDQSGKDLVKQMRKLGKHPERYQNYENENICQDGKRVWVSWTNRPLYDNEGDVTEILSIGNDITEQKRGQEALRAEQRKLLELLASHERERKLIAYEIHDGLAQHLVAAKMRFQATEQRQSAEHSEEEWKRAANMHREGLLLLDRGIAEARRLISGLRPLVLDEFGVVAAIEHLVHELQQGNSEANGPKIELDIGVQFRRLNPLLENSLFRIVQEALTNSLRYSQSDRVSLKLRQTDHDVHLEIRDWGIGFDPDAIGEDRFGVRGIRARARLFGGGATIESSPGTGTRIVVDIPLIDTSAMSESEHE